MNDENMIKGNNQLSQQEVNLLREKFLNEYSKSKGWNPDELSTIQMLEVSSQKDYKTPGLILG